MTKRLMLSKGFTLPKALLVFIVNCIVTVLTYWQTANFELSIGVFVGIILAVIPVITNYEEIPEPAPVQLKQ